MVAETPYPQAPDRTAERSRAALLGAAALALGAAAGALAAPGLGPLAGALAGAAAGALVVTPWMLRRRGVPVLTYHSVSPDARWLPWAEETSIRPGTLDAQCALYRRMGYTAMSSEAFARARLGQAEMPKRPLVLHFDDGYLDNRLHAWPILRRHGLTATLFVSTDFIEPGDRLRAPGRGAADDGFLTWAELREMDASPEWHVEAHGTDHGHVVTGPRVVGRVTAQAAPKLAWMQWLEMPGPKHDWYRRDDPARLVGREIREHAPALSAAAEGEDALAYEARVRDVLTRARDTLQRELGRRPRVFCWPENRTTDAARRVARELGYIATTAGRGRNTVAEDPEVMSRVHVGEDYAGFRSAALDRIALRAHLRAMEGNLWWGLPLLAFGLSKRIARKLGRRRRAASPARRTAGRTAT